MVLHRSWLCSLLCSVLDGRLITTTNCNIDHEQSCSEHQGAVCSCESAAEELGICVNSLICKTKSLLSKQNTTAKQLRVSLEYNSATTESFALHIRRHVLPLHIPFIVESIVIMHCLRINIFFSFSGVLRYIGLSGGLSLALHA